MYQPKFFVDIFKSETANYNFIAYQSKTHAIPLNDLIMDIQSQQGTVFIIDVKNTFKLTTLASVKVNEFRECSLPSLNPFCNIKNLQELDEQLNCFIEFIVYIAYGAKNQKIKELEYSVLKSIIINAWEIHKESLGLYGIYSELQKIVSDDAHVLSIKNKFITKLRPFNLMPYANLLNNKCESSFTSENIHYFDLSQVEGDRYLMEVIIMLILSKITYHIKNKLAYTTKKVIIINEFDSILSQLSENLKAMSILTDIFRNIRAKNGSIGLVFNSNVKAYEIPSFITQNSAWEFSVDKNNKIKSQFYWDR